MTKNIIRDDNFLNDDKVTLHEDNLDSVTRMKVDDKGEPQHTMTIDPMMMLTSALEPKLVVEPWNSDWMTFSDRILFTRIIL